jgi:hypothetical protein
VRCSSQKRCKVTTYFWNHQIFRRKNFKKVEKTMKLAKNE